jgi:hypothetical protein
MGAVALVLAIGVLKGRKWAWEATMTIAVLLLVVSIAGVVMYSLLGILLGIIEYTLQAIMMAIGIILLRRPEARSFCVRKKSKTHT